MKLPDRFVLNPECMELKIEDLTSTVTPKQEERMRRHLQKLLEDIKENGIKESMIVIWSERTKKWLILDGDHRFIRAKILGIKTVKAQIREERKSVNWKSCPYPNCEWSGSEKDVEYHVEIKHRRKKRLN